MRKALVTVAASMMLWAGSAQAAVTVEFSGTIAYSGDPAQAPQNLLAEYGIGPIAISGKSVFDNQTLSHGDGSFLGTVSSFIIDGIDYAAESDAVFSNWESVYNFTIIKHGDPISAAAVFYGAITDPTWGNQKILSANPADYGPPRTFFQVSAKSSIDYVLTNISFTVSGTPAIGYSVPEPATWLTMILGFGMIGGALRRRCSPALKSTSAL